MKRLALIVITAVLSTLALSSPAAAAPARCVPVPDLEGHVWQLCLH